MKISRFILSLLGASALAAAAAAATTVSVNTSSLTQGGTYYIDFQLNDGNSAGDGNNSAYISSFNFGGGAASGVATGFGGVSGDLYSDVTLTDSDPFNEFYQAFAAGTLFNFDLLLSNSFNGEVPDMFGFAILDENLFNLGTYSLGSDQFLTVELNGAPLVYQTYAGVDGIPAPHVPEGTSTALLTAGALLGLVGVRRCALPSLLAS